MSNFRHDRNVRIIISLVLLLAGTSIYILWRPEALLNNLFEPLSLPKGSIVPPEWFLYSLPDALWYGALLALMPSPFLLITDKETPKIIPVMTIISILLPFAHELLQRYHLAPGTFCHIDMISYSVILLIYLIICTTKIRKRQPGYKDSHCVPSL